MRIPAKYLLYIFSLSFVIINAFLPQKIFLPFGLKSYLKSASFIFLSVAAVIAEWAVIIRCFSAAGQKRFFYAAIVLFPITFLFFWNPYINPHLPFIIPVGIIFFAQVCFLAALSNNKYFLSFFRRPIKHYFY